MEGLLMFDAAILAEDFVRLLIALVFGAVLGTERTLAHKKAGLRTYGLVSMGSCLFVLIAVMLEQLYAGRSADLIRFDFMRIIAGIITGVGFLGTGVIIFRDTSLSGGLTTAAGLWVAAGIGVAAGFGLYALAVFATVLTLTVFTLLWFIEDRVKDIANGIDNEHY